jgi:hypothetical protein
MQVQRAFTDGRNNPTVPNQAIKFQQPDEQAIAINLKVIEELGRQVNQAGSKLVVVDASRYFPFLKWEGLSALLEKFSAEKGFGWIPLGDELLQAEKKGIVTRWPYDQHFNETGNKMFAEAMQRWMTRQSEDAQPSVKSSYDKTH